MMELSKIKEEEAEIVPFTLLTGGKGTGKEWLTSLEEGTIFLVSPIGPKTYVLIPFIKIRNSARGNCLLLSNINNKEEHVWVEPIYFCECFKLKEILVEGNRTDRTE